MFERFASRTGRWLVALAIGIAVSGCGKKGGTRRAADQEPARRAARSRPAGKEARKMRAPARADDLERRIAVVREKLKQFVPTKLDFDDKLLDETDKKVVAKLVAAADVIDQLFLVQVDEQNPKIRAQLAADPKLKDVLAYFDIMYGVWDRLDHDKPFWGDRPKPPGASFYPPDMTKKEFEDYLKAHPEQAKAFRSYFTVIRRRNGKLVAIPYSEYYAPYLKRAAKLLREAAAVAKDPRLKRYLELRAKAFETNEYRESDMAWMDLGDGKLEVVIGPYEVYEDRLFGYKASFEAFVCLRDPVYSARLQKIAAHKQDMERALPIPDEHKNFKRGSTLPITVVDEMYSAGDTRAGVQTLAFNLPNDEVVRQKKGYKLVLLKNVGHAKFDKILMPIARRLLAPDVLRLVTFDAFFTNTLMHETAHGQGPGQITVLQNGRKVTTDVNRALKEVYPAIEEAKADIVGLYLTRYLVQKKVLPEDLAKSAYASFLAGFFRAVRFGATEAHGKANLVSFNYLRRKGAIVLDEATGLYSIDFHKVADAVRDLAHDLLMLEAKGDYEAAKKFLATYGVMTDELRKAISKLKGIPVDIRPVFTVKEKLRHWGLAPK